MAALQIVGQDDVARPSMREVSGGSLWLIAALLGLALAGSGAAALINQVVWQRALKSFLGGSEAISAMTVVLVFMAGLGFGSLAMGRYSGRLRNPLLALAAVELLLAVVNLGVRVLFGADVSASIVAAQTAVVAVGAPLPVLYVVSAIVVLLAPCLLMGATMPLASEACQRQLGLGHTGVLGRLFFINTLGSVGGALAASFLLIPWCGLRLSMLLAVGANVAAAVAVAVLWAALPPVARWIAIRQTPATAANESASHSSPRPGWRPTRFEWLAAGFGFCSLGYEVLLFRFFALAFEPLPHVFAAVLTGFLLLWSLGAGAASRTAAPLLPRYLLWCAWGTLVAAPLFTLGFAMPYGSAWRLALLIAFGAWSFLPCFFYGMLFTGVTTLCARSWGHDVGRVCAWNTCGSCAGVLAMTFVGTEINPLLALIALGLALLGLRSAAHRVTPVWPRPTGNTWRGAISGVAAAAVVVIGLCGGDGGIPATKLTWFFGRDGVVGVDNDGDMFWDGLWHSALSDGANHVGTNNWKLAVAPVLVHSTGDIQDVCVVGVGTGVTVATLAKLDSVRHVDAYDLNHTLRQLYREFPAGTLGVAVHPKVRLLWQDARSGLALREQKYDVIQTQPLYLKQAGSGLLNSREFYELVRSRLKPGGVFCLYSNGTAEQALVVRNTARQVFRHGETMYDGYLLVLSDDPLDVTPAALAQRYERFAADPLWREIRGHGPTATAAAAARWLDTPRLSWDAGPLIITDDFPIIEYPLMLRKLLTAAPAAGDRRANRGADARGNVGLQ